MVEAAGVKAKFKDDPGWWLARRFAQRWGKDVRDGSVEEPLRDQILEMDRHPELDNYEDCTDDEIDRLFAEYINRLRGPGTSGGNQRALGSGTGEPVQENGGDTA